MSNCVDAGIGSCAEAVPVQANMARNMSATVNDVQRILLLRI